MNYDFSSPLFSTKIPKKYDYIIYVIDEFNNVSLQVDIRDPFKQHWEVS